MRKRGHPARTCVVCHGPERKGEVVVEVALITELADPPYYRLVWRIRTLGVFRSSIAHFDCLRS